MGIIWEDYGNHYRRWGGGGVYNYLFPEIGGSGDGERSEVPTESMGVEAGIVVSIHVSYEIFVTCTLGPSEKKIVSLRHS